MTCSWRIDSVSGILTRRTLFLVLNRGELKVCPRATAQKVLPSSLFIIFIAWLLPYHESL